MAPILKTLPILLATATIICGATVKKSEKRGIADFSSGFSSSKLEGSGIKISTDFGKELTLEEYKQNGYSFGDDKQVGLGLDTINNNNFGTKFGLQDNDNFNLGQQFLHISHSQQSKGIVPDIANYGIQQANLGVQETQGNIQTKDFHFTQNGVSTENQDANYFGSNIAQINQENNNRESSSVSYITQNIPFSVPQPYPVVVNRPVPVPVPQAVPVSIPKPVAVSVPVPYSVQVNKPYLVSVNQPVPVLHSVRVFQKQEVPVPVPQSYPVHATQPQPQNLFIPDANTQNGAYSQNEQSSEGQVGNFLQNGKEIDHDIQRKEISPKLSTLNINQISSHESESTANNGFIPMENIPNLQKLQSSDHQSSQVSLHNNLQTVGAVPSQIDSHSLSQTTFEGTHLSSPGFQQNFQTVGYQLSQGQQPSEAHSSLTHLGQSTFNAQENYQTNTDLSSLRSIQQKGEYSAVSPIPHGAQYNFQEQQATAHPFLNGVIQNFQGNEHASPVGYQQGLQTNADQSILVGLAHGAQYNFQGFHQGQQATFHPSLNGLQQSSHRNEGQVAIPGYFPKAGETGTFSQFQIASQPKVGGYNEQPQQDLQ